MSGFYHYLAAYYDKIFPHNPIKTEFIEGIVPDKEAKILDVGCATGEMALSFAKKGYTVTGIDLDEKLIEISESKTITGETTVNFMQADMNNIDQLFNEEQFDLITCFGNTLVHLENISEINDFIEKCHHILEPGGKIIIQTVNYDRLSEQRIDELPEIEREEILFKRMYLYDAYPEKINFKVSLTVKDEDKSFTANTFLIPLQSQELEKMLIDSGFRANLYGSFKNEKFKKDSPALIAVGEKIS